MHAVLRPVLSPLLMARGRILGGAVCLACVLGEGFLSAAPSTLVSGGLLGAFLLVTGGFGVRLHPDIGVGPIELVLDIVCLTLLLATWGGSGNPLTMLYLLPVVLGGLVLQPWSVVAVLVASVVGYGLLFFIAPSPHMHHPGMGSHLWGMFLTHAGSGMVVVGALLLGRHSVTRAEAEASEARETASLHARLKALGSLAAGASHELSSPLSTMLVVTRELERRAELREDGVATDDLDDLELLREEIGRCRDILHQMSADVGQGMGERSRDLQADALLAAASSGDPRVVVHNGSDGLVVLPERLIVLAVRRLLGNARDADPSGAPIELSLSTNEDSVFIDVIDKGCGMDSDTLARATEPFYTTKDTGTGLGLHFVHAVAAQLGGKLLLVSQPGEGTHARLEIPFQAAGAVQ